MAEQSGFFADVGGDRTYTDTFLAQWIASFISNGVYNGELGVTAGDHMQVIIPTGRGWINGYYYRNDGDLVLPIANADGVLNRKDIVVLRWDVNARSITAQVVKGTPASNPVAPAIVRGTEQYDLKLAEISIPAGTTAITQDLIIDTRLDNTVCGFVHGVVQQVDTSTLFAQYQVWYTQITGQAETDISNKEQQFQDDFNTWFAGIKATLDGDTAGNLLNIINDLAGEGRTTETVKGNADAIAALAGAGNTTTVKALKDDLDAHKSDYVDHPCFALDTSSTANTIVITPNPTITGYSDGMCFAVKIKTANTGASTLNVNGKGAKAIKKSNGNDVSSGNLKAGSIYTLRYNATTGNFILQGEGGEYGTAAAAQVLTGYTIGTENGLVNGSMPNNGAQNKTISSPGSVTIPAGYTTGGTVTANYEAKPNLSPGGSIIAALDTAETIKNDGGGIWTKVKEYQILWNGTVRVTFDLTSVNGSYAGRGQVWINGVAVGTDHSSLDGKTFVQDFTVHTNDLIQIYVKNNSIHPEYGITAANFRISVLDTMFGNIKMN